MENKINVAELLKDCPKGMELDCTMFENVTFVRVDISREQFPIEITVGGIRSKYLTKEGCFHDTILLPESKCIIFPKGKTTWEGFQRPFKDGDIVFTTLGNIAIIRKPIEGELFYVYGILVGNGFYKDETAKVVVERLTTEEEKQILFDAIKANGYRWNPDNKTLEKLIEPTQKPTTLSDVINAINAMCQLLMEETIKVKIPEGYEFVGVDDNTKHVLFEKIKV